MVPPRAGFPRHSRLGSPREFSRVFAAPVRSSDALFTVLARPSAGAIPRLGLTVSRRAAKKAVDRNRIKRIAREAFRSQHDLPPWDFVVLARPAAAQAEAALLRASLEGHFARLRRRAAGGASDKR